MHTRILMALALLGSASAANVGPGQSIYTTNCAGCRGSRVQGQLGSNLHEAAGWKYALFSRAILHSRDDKGMALQPPIPVWGKIGFKGDHGTAPTAAEMHDLQAYLKTLK
ncbi:cytochrome c [Deinococcus sonorensis]|uniref:Cytochrome c n=2 Tax=Deinococcus sonorensis TaxID=309891 RepID=A0AAU7UCH5_9DEIO